MNTVIESFERIKQKVVQISKSLHFDKLVNNTGRKLALSIENSISLALFKQKQGIETKKSIYEIFRPPCSYKTLVVNMNRWYKLALQIVGLILNRNRQAAHPVKHIDSTNIPVCRNKNAKHHQTMKDYASWGNNGQGYYYGLKLHLIADLKQCVLALKFTSANVDDRAAAVPLAEGLSGIFVADAGYVSAELEQDFYREGERYILIKPKKNQKKLATELDGLLYSTRMLVEIPFRILKLFHGFITSLPRSVAGYLANYTYSLLAYLLA
jgi:IS5 family transposase